MDRTAILVLSSALLALAACGDQTKASADSATAKSTSTAASTGTAKPTTTATAAPASTGEPKKDDSGW